MEGPHPLEASGSSHESGTSRVGDHPAPPLQAREEDGVCKLCNGRGARHAQDAGERSERVQVIGLLNPNTLWIEPCTQCPQGTSERVRRMQVPENPEGPYNLCALHTRRDRTRRHAPSFDNEPLDRESRTANAKHRTPNPKSQFPNPKPIIPNPYQKLQALDHKP